MKNIYRNCAVVFIVAAMVLTSANAFAFPAVAGQYNGVFFKNSELFYDNDDDGLISPGDWFQGVIQLNGIIAAGTDESGQTGSNIWPVAGAPPTAVEPFEITGYFLQEVTQVIPGAGCIGTIIFGLSTTVDPLGVLNVGAGEVLQIFESNTLNFNDSTQGTAFATAIDGTPTFSLGFVDGDNYWYTPNVALDPFALEANEGVGTTYSGLDYIDQPAWQYNDVNDPNEAFFDTWVNFWFNSEIFKLGNVDLAFGDDLAMHFGSNDPGVHFPVPEPSTFMLLGAGLLGILFVGMKRKRN